MTTINRAGIGLEAGPWRWIGRAWVAGVLVSLTVLPGEVLEVPPAKELLARHLAAVGGAAVLERAGAAVYRGSGREGERAFEAELRLKPPGQVLLTLKSANGLVFQHGRSADGRFWSRTPDGLRQVSDAGQQRDLLDLAHALAPYGPGALLELYASNRSYAITREGKPCFGIRTEGEWEPRLVFDAATGLLDQVGDVRVFDYRPGGGLRLPHSVRVGANVSFQFEAVELGGVVPDTAFAVPTEAEAEAAPRVGQEEFRTLLSKPGQLEIMRQPKPLDFRRGALKSLPRWSPLSSQHAQVDLRGCDLQALDVRDRLVDLLHADFDSRTRFPAVLPEGYRPEAMLAWGRDPGLGVRSLHSAGVTGKGIGIGIIDQTLLVDHVEYRDRLRLYEEIHYAEGAPASMHGPAVASIAAGRGVGVAPEAELYFIAEWHMTPKAGVGQEWDFAPLAEAIHRLLEVNAMLPLERRIRVISISVGWSPGQAGYAESKAAVERAKREGVFVVSTCLEDMYGLRFHGLGREPRADPNRAESFGPGSWWKSMFWKGGYHQFDPGERLLVPMDCRATAGPAGVEDYAYYDSAGWSWSVPWIAGLYALGCQVKPDLTPEVFWAEALKTGRTIRLEREGKALDFGTIADPVALIARLRELH